MEHFKKLIDDSSFQLYNYDSLKIGCLLGEGASAKVYSTYFNGKEYAAKIYKNNEYEGFYDDLSYELKIAKRLKNSKYSVNVHSIGYGFINNKFKIILFMDLLKSYGDLYDYIQNIATWRACYKVQNKLIPKPKTNYIYYNEDDKVYWCYELSKKQKVRITKMVLQSINELHLNGIIHGDIKTDNMILHYEYRKEIIKLIDFGMSYLSEGDECINMEYISGTHGYRAPEQDEFKISFSSDIYSMGVTIIEIWNGDIWKNGETFDDLRKEVLLGLDNIEKENKEFAILLKKCISYEYQKRPHISTVFQIFSKISF